MTTPTLPPFETLEALARQRPEALEALRQELVEAVILQAPPSRRQRLRGLQFHIEQRCRLAPTPLMACIELSRHMHRSLRRLQTALQDGQPPEKISSPARVLPFTRPSAPEEASPK